MLNPYLKIGPVNVHFYGLIIALAIYIGYYLAKKRAKIYKINPKIFDDSLLILPLVLAIIGARIYHVLDYYSTYSKNPISVFFIQNGGLGIWGAILGAVIGFYFFAKLRKLNLLTILDLASPSLLLGQAIGRIGNWINQEGFGPPTSLPWGVYINEQNRPFQFQNFSHFHPTFFYEAILNLAFFIALIKLSQRFKRPGQIFGLYLISYSLIRFSVEFLRIDTWVVSQLKIAHLISVVVLFIGVYLFRRAGNKVQP
ncbi:MAG: Prolipoprotein diacylglyceryl transferase [Candidatus Curtissbacteria bacterium GW2011_GWA1_40_16]|uniref:Phosphatidylglycerol--prolipoprotein diacylglyceryl transferase n=1 Tax=Candidatus Curtissbacteria bacterium GW2011_GWA1_40_16 TaxID=1618405 RepID=A0A0G0RHP9_9BACT|nr:MAG: Prolipoprotein diacylglyceryl transferase [Candidatus Curtissbacteria bacterium GW2011_GWA1_40_16]